MASEQMEQIKEATSELNHKEMDRKYEELKRTNSERQVVPLDMWCDRCKGLGGWWETPRNIWVLCSCQEV